MTKIYNTQAEIDADIKNYLLKYDGDIVINFDDAIIEGNINAWDINAGNIEAWDIKANNINANDIKAGIINANDINAWDINAGNINANDINANDIKAWDINAGNIEANDINAGIIKAWDIIYYAVCFAYQSITCKSIVGTRVKHRHFCLDSEINIKRDYNND